jgi:hypothetical protein
MPNKTSNIQLILNVYFNIGYVVFIWIWTYTIETFLPQEKVPPTKVGQNICIIYKKGGIVYICIIPT